MTDRRSNSARLRCAVPPGVTKVKKWTAGDQFMNSFARLLVLVTAGTLLDARANAQVAESWATEIRNGSGFSPNLLVQPSGHLQLFGRSQSDSIAVRVDSNGVALWSQRFDSNLATINSPVGQVADGAGNVYVACNDDSSAFETAQIALLKYAGDGTLLWTKFLPGTNAGGAFASRLALDSQGRVIIAGTAYNSARGDSDIVAIKCDPDGAVLWSARYDEALYETPSSLAVDHADNIYVAGFVSNQRTPCDLLVVKYDANGQQIWVAHYDNPAHGSDFPVAIHVDSAGNATVSGYSFANPTQLHLSRLELVKFDSSGQILWNAHHSGAPNEVVYAIAAAHDSSGNVLVAGGANSYADNTANMLLVKFDPAGGRLWAARYNAPRNGAESVRGLAVDTFGNAYLTGDSQEGDNLNYPDTKSYFTRKFDPLGNRLWDVSRPSNRSFYNYPGGVGLDAAGGVYIAGRFENDTNSQDSGWLAVKYVQIPAPGLPSILSPPASQTVHPRSTVAFTVAAAGDAPLRYQWRYNGRIIGQATNATFALSNIQFSQRGGYSVDVSNAVGVVATAEAELVVLEPPAITLQPSSQTTFAGTEAAFTVAVTGLDPFSYQWRHDEANLPGATNSTLALLNVQAADAGRYSVLVGNIAGSITSRVAVLTVSTQVTRSWAARYDGPAKAIELGPLLALDGAGLPVVTVTSQGTVTDLDFATLKHDATGVRLWVSRFNSASNRADHATALFVDSAGNAYVAGHSLGDDRAALAAAKYDPAGELLWSLTTTNYDWRTDVPCVITADSAGNTYIAACAAGHVETFKYDVAGNLLWVARHDEDMDEQPRAIAVDPAGNICVAIRVVYYAYADFIVQKYGPDGQSLWQGRYDGDEEGGGDGNDTLFGMGLDAAGNIYLAGQAAGTALAVVKFDATGNRVWVARHRSVHNTTPTAFAVNAAGASWLAYISSASGSDAEGGELPVDAFDAVAHFGADGRERWVCVPTRAGFGSLSGLAVDNAGNAYTAGTMIRDGSGSDLAASRIDSNGTLLWTALYNGPANGDDNGSAIAVSPTGDIFVAGTSGDSGGLPDVALLKYRENTLPGLPEITAPPRNVLTRVGSNVTFVVTATGAGPLHYQWLFNGAPLAGATASSLTVAVVNDGNVGFYAIEVSNLAGTVRSPAGRLEILPLPVIFQQPLGQDSVAGGSACFTVSAGGVAPLTYQWLFNGVPIADATNTTLRLEDVQSAQAGNYSVLVADAVGPVLSQPARLNVSLAATKCQEWDHPVPQGTYNSMITRDSTGHLYVAGAAFNADANADYLALKYGADGQLLWQARYDSTGGHDNPSAIVVDGAGNVHVTGGSVLQQSSAFATVKYDAQGNELWSRRRASTNGSDFAGALAVDSSGNVVVIGTSVRVEGGQEARVWLTVKYDPNGTELWSMEYRGPGRRFEEPRSLVVDPAGNIYVAGSSDGITYDGHFATIKYSPGGQQLWVARYEQVSGGASALALDAAGNVVVAGWSTPWATFGPGNEIVTVKYDNAGNQLWAAHYLNATPRVYAHRAVAVDAGGNVLVTGESGGDIATLKYDPSGRQLWAERLQGPAFSGDEASRDLAVDGAGNVYVAGFGDGLEPGTTDLLAVKYDSAGNRIWVTRKPGASFDLLHSGLVLDDAGDVYVVGAFGNELTTIKYCQTNTPGLPAIVVPPQGQSVVIGTSVAFTVVASGAHPLSYQWRFNGLAIPGASGSTFLVPNAQPANAGGYSVEVFNPLGSVVSAEATLSVHLPATISAPPVDDCVIAGGVARFRVSATGDLPITFQWSFGGLEIQGATSDTLLVSNVQPSQVGLYTVRASNPFGGATASASLSLLPNVQQLWSRVFDNVNPPPINGTDLDDRAAVSTVDGAGNLYVAGTSIAPTLINPPRDIFIVKYDAAGALQWVAHHGSGSHVERRPTAIAVNAAGEVHLAVDDFTGTNSPALLKYDANGQLLWTARFPGADLSHARALSLDAAGNAYVIEQAFRLMKVSPAGTRLWTAIHPLAFALAVTVDGAGNVYVAGAAFAPENGQPNGRGLDYLTVKYNAAGVEQWSRTFRGPHGLENTAYAIAVDSIGNVMVTGSYVVQPGNSGNLSSRLNIGTFKYDPNGNVLWFADYGNTNTADFPVAMALDAAGNVLITGYSEDFENGGQRWVTLKYHSEGSLNWTRAFGQRSPYTIGPPVGLVVDATGNSYLTGALPNPESAQPVITTVKYGPAGDELWSAEFRDSTFSGVSYGTYAVGVHVDEIGRVRVAGSIGSYVLDVVVLAYAQEASPGAPVILLQPQDATVLFGGQAQFSVNASNALRFQWQFDGRELSGADSATLVLPAVDASHEGRYSVRVESDTYCVVSRPAKLTLDLPAPIITSRGFSQGSFNCTVLVVSGRTYRIEVSTDLVNWTTLSQEIAYGRTITFYDYASPWQPWRFYRVVEGAASD